MCVLYCVGIVVAIACVYMGGCGIDVGAVVTRVTGIH